MLCFPSSFFWRWSFLLKEHILKNSRTQKVISDRDDWLCRLVVQTGCADSGYLSGYLWASVCAKSFSSRTVLLQTTLPPGTSYLSITWVVSSMSGSIVFLFSALLLDEKPILHLKPSFVEPAALILIPPKTFTALCITSLSARASMFSLFSSREPSFFFVVFFHVIVTKTLSLQQSFVLQDTNNLRNYFRLLLLLPRKLRSCSTNLLIFCNHVLFTRGS